MSVMVTGGCGFLGSHLVRRLVEDGEDVVVFDLMPNHSMLEKLGSKVKMVKGDITIMDEVVQAAKANDVEKIFHMAAILSIPSEENPLYGLKVNGWGTVNILEAARLLDMERVIFPSSMATYGPGVKQPVDEKQRQEPRSTYGVAKVLSELWGLYYYERYGLDFRALRLTAGIGPGKATGVTAYASLMVQNPVMREPYEAYVDETTVIPLIYFKDSVNALHMLYKAQSPKSRIYNVGALTPLAVEIAGAVKAQIPGAEIRFRPREEMLMLMRDWPVPDPTKIQGELGWRLEYDLERLVADFISEVRGGA